MMKIKKILNNNAILVNEKKGIDCVWIGSGIGFKKNIGDIPDKNRIERRFIIDKSQSLDEISQLLNSISTDYLKLSVDIVEYAKENITQTLSNSLYISLADHIANSINLNRKGLSSGTVLSWEVKKLYPREYKISKKAIKMIEEQTGISLGEFEIGSIALHLINAQTQYSDDSEMISKKIKDILTLIRIQNKIELDPDSIAYDRFVTHLRFFFKRVESRSINKSKNSLILEIKSRYSKAFDTMKLIENYLELTLNEDEQVYLCLHIQKLIEDF